MAKNTGGSRVRWTAEEKDILIDHLMELRSQHHDWTLRNIVEKGQEILPAARRRPAYPPLVSWANKAMRKKAASGTQPKVSVVAASPAPDADAPRAAAEATERGASSDLLADALVSYGIRAGAAIVAGILRDPAVQRSLASLVADALREASGAPDDAESPAATEGGAASQAVLILGLSDEQAAEFSRAYRGLLQLKFDRGTATSAELRAALGEAGCVIAMEGTVASEVSRLLHQATPTYIRHTTGIAGLRQRLANLAITDSASSTPRKRGQSNGTPRRRHG